MHRADEHFTGNGRVTAARARHIPVIGVGGPVGSGKTALVEALCLRLRDRVSLAVVHQGRCRVPYTPGRAPSRPHSGRRNRGLSSYGDP